MIDGTGMCGGCRLTVGGETKFACVDGPDFDGHLVDYDEPDRRATASTKQEETAAERAYLPHHIGGYSTMANMSMRTKTPMPEQEPQVRNKNFKEVAHRLHRGDGRATRPSAASTASTSPACPAARSTCGFLSFIAKVAEGKFEEAYEIITLDQLACPPSAAASARRRPSASRKCVRGIKGESVGIGRLERFVADYAHASTRRPARGDQARFQRP